MYDINELVLKYKDLLKRVDLLQDKTEHNERINKDLLYNLDNTNFSDSVLQEKQVIKNQLSDSSDGLTALLNEIFPKGIDNKSSVAANADEIKSRITADVLSSKLLNYYTKEQTNGSIDTLKEEIALLRQEITELRERLENGN